MSLYKKLFGIFEEHFLMYAMLGVLVGSCIGAGASMLILHEGHGFLEMFQIGMLVTVCMGYNATILSDRKAKTVFNWGITSVLVCTLILLIHLI